MSAKNKNNNHAVADTQSAKSAPTSGELDRLRDILFGDHARDVSTQIVELRQQVSVMDDTQTERVENNHHELKTRLADLEATLAINAEQARNDLENLSQLIATQRATQKQMGEMLVQLGQRLLED